MRLRQALHEFAVADHLRGEKFQPVNVSFPNDIAAVVMARSKGIRLGLIKELPMSKVRYCLFASLLLFSSFTFSHCERAEVIQVLDSINYSYEPGDDDGDYNFYVTKEDETMFMWVEPDGDMSFRKVYTSDVGWEGVDLRSLMLDFKYVAAYIDESGNVAFSYDVKAFGDQCPQTLANSIDFFFGLMVEVEAKLRAMWVVLKEEAEPRPQPALISI